MRLKSLFVRQYVLPRLTIDAGWIIYGNECDYKDRDSNLHTWNVLFLLKDAEDNSREQKVTKLMKGSNDRAK